MPLIFVKFINKWQGDVPIVQQELIDYGYVRGEMRCHNTLQGILMRYHLFLKCGENPSCEQKKEYLIEWAREHAKRYSDALKNGGRSGLEKLCNSYCENNDCVGIEECPLRDKSYLIHMAMGDTELGYWKEEKYQNWIKYELNARGLNDDSFHNAHK